MRWKLLRRRLTISAPRVAVRSALPWPFRWALVALMLGFCGAISLWAFELGKDLAGIDTPDKDEIIRLHAEVDRLRSERDKLQSILNTSGSLMTAERSAQEKLAAQIRALEAENRTLRDDLGFFEKLIPSNGNEAVAIRGLQADLLPGGQLKWQVLLSQPARNAPEFHGRLLVTVTGTLDDKPWSLELPTEPDLRLRQFRRLEGTAGLPERAVVKTVAAKVLEGSTTRATQTIRLGGA